MQLDRWTKYIFNNNKVATNRVVVPPMASQTASPTGFVTADTRAHYERLSQSGAGIVIAEYTYIHQTGRGEPSQLGIDQDSHVAGLAQVASATQSAGALAGLQLVHVGGKTDSELTGFPLLGPSPVAVPVQGRQLELPTAMSTEQIQEMVSWYVDAAKRVASAGFDLIEVHAAHGYGLNQWLSPITNHRLDGYGKNMEGRARLLFEIVQQIKAHLPHLLLSVRLPAQDYFPGGLQVGNMKWVVVRLEGLGVDMINVSSGIGGWRRPQGINGEGYLISDATQLKGATSLPVIGVGGIESGEFIDSILTNIKVDFAAVGRAILQDPQAWRRKHLEHLSPCRRMVL